VRASADPEHQYASVRFGDVLGSSGSVLQVFVRRLRACQPLEIRHPEASRYFLAGSEAAGLLILAAGLAAAGDLLVMETGPQRRIQDLATDLIHMQGAALTGGAVPSPATRITALRPGERIDERLSDGEPQVVTEHPCIVRLREVARDPHEIRSLADALTTACDKRRVTPTLKILGRLVPEYRASRAPL
jgi:FlaA1/EpsC-like NDP-sugar epimerase